MPEPWVNAVIEVTVALDVPVDAPYPDKQAEVERIMERLTFDQNFVLSGHFEDVCVEDDDVVPYKRKSASISHESTGGSDNA